MATCQGERWIEVQVASILEQLGPRDEIVVADASSTDRTLEIVRDLAGDRAKILDRLPRGNVPATFEAALRECKGETIFLSDQDDEWLPGKVEICAEALSGIRLLALHDARVIGMDGRILSESFFAERRMRAGFWPNLWRPGYLGCALAMRRELLDVALPFPVGVPMHDWWLGLLAERKAGVALVREPLLLHRRHGNNANFDPNQSPYPLSQRWAFRWKIWQDIQRRLEERP